MSRATRLEYEGAFYHVMSRGVARMSTFLNDEDRRSFLKTLGGLVEGGALEVHAFCLMPNHYHLLLRTPHGGLARWMRHVNGDYVRGFNYRRRRVGRLWQGRYKAILVGDARYLKECSRYVHLNPNRAKMTRPAERYPWSSYRNYVGGPKAVPWVETGVVLGEFGGNRERYRAYVEGGKGERPVSPFDQAVAGMALGSEEFLVRVRRMLKGRKNTGDQPSLGAWRWVGRAEPERVREVAERVFAGERPARRRRLVMLAHRLHSNLRPAEIARRCGRTPSAVSMAVRQLGEEARKNPNLAAGLSALAKALDDRN